MRWLLALALFGMVAMAAAAERLEDKVATRADPAQQYALYLPDGASAKTPLLIVLDPRGRGAMARDLVLDGARARGWGVMSSWQSRSDTQEGITLRALDALLKDSAHVPHDPRRVYLAGMSGTAKTLWVVQPVLRDRIAGLIGSGGARPPELPALQGAPAFFGFAGTTDFNYQEMVALDDALGGAPHRLVVFDGPHGWPASEAFVEAIAWMDVQAMRAQRMPRDAALIDARWQACTEEATTDALARWREIDACIRDLDGLHDISTLRAHATALAASEDVQRLRKQEDRLRDEESRQRRRFEEWRARFSARFVEGRPQSPPSHATTMRELRIANLRKRATDADARIAESAMRQLAWMHAGAAFYLPPMFAGDAERLAALKRLAEATAPP
ncbi:hypothetical protein [Noviluteimonas dokdonensis]|uniref:hypothetical protein n=1 Tax=Noviluteimonas dokdonensis TaxID=414050 RepID=UPI00126A31F7|nr:hypothetical protein [Lysobacter dokdonensis]